MVLVSGPRISWADLPAPVQRAIEAIIGDRVVEAVSQVGGFSPGTADRVITESGRRAFVKAAGTALNERTVELHRQEAAISARLPGTFPAPRLLGSYDDGDWIALVLEDVEGRQPRTPWRADELEAVLAALTELAREPAPATLSDLPKATDAMRHLAASWDLVAADPPADLDDWVKSHLDSLAAMAHRGIGSLTGDRVIHRDIRSDNLLVRPDGQIVIVDWPWASIGPAWFDTVLLLVEVQTVGGADVPALIAETMQQFGADEPDAYGLIAAFAGYCVHSARLPAPPNIPNVRAFQRTQGEALIRLLRARN
jgi:aminoglycoside phosphotransferase (APT) family kinase protein